MSEKLARRLELAHRALLLASHNMKINAWTRVGELAADEGDEKVFGLAHEMLQILGEVGHGSRTDRSSVR